MWICGAKASQPARSSGGNMQVTIRWFFSRPISSLFLLPASRTARKSTTHRNVVNMIPRILSVNWNPTNPMTISVIEQCANNGKAVEAAEILRLHTTIVMVAKPIFPIICPSSVGGAYLGWPITITWSPLQSFSWSDIQSLVENHFLLIVSLHWSVTLYYWNIIHSRTESRCQL